MNIRELQSKSAVVRETLDVPGHRLAETVDYLTVQGIVIEGMETGSTNGIWRLTVRRPELKP